MSLYEKKNGGVAEVAEYIAEQQRKGWPGSASIHPHGCNRASRVVKKALAA